MEEIKIPPVDVVKNGQIPVPPPRPMDAQAIIETFAHRMMYSVAKDRFTATDYDLFTGLALAVRDRLMDRWFATQKNYYETDTKRVYYLSLEFMTGRLLQTNLLNLGAEEAGRSAMARLGFDLDLLRESEEDSALGNGGLGRLAACFLDSAATLSIPFYGYGIRYEYGIFRQRIVDGAQVEAPDNWLRYGNPWEIPRPEVLFPVRFYGRSHYYKDESGEGRYSWEDPEQVWAMAYDVPILGYRNDTVNSLRLWAAKSSREFDLARFNAGEYVRAVEDKNNSENISKVLYPADDQYVGKELRLKQQYFFVSATLQDVIRRFRKRKGRTWDQLPDKVAIQLNDTHPAIAIPELMRVLVDEERLAWDMAWNVTERIFGYTNHTVLPEALEAWSTDLMGRLLPRHLQIVEEIDRRLRTRVQTRFPADEEKLKRMSIIDDDARTVRMANLAVVGSHSVNGVAKLHTQIIKRRVFPDFVELYPDRFNAKTNGVTPRRWLLKCNPPLAELITEAIGDGWITNLDRLSSLRRLVDDAVFREKWAKIKYENKVTLAEWLERVHGIRMNPESLFDCQIKRIHEYKRQLLNIMHAIALFLRLRDGAQETPRTIIFAGKAAPSYFIAKLIIRLINAVSVMIEREPKARERLQVVFVPDYRVTVAEKTFPACDLSEQISTAGTEASGTGNMKAALNGALTIGTLDGANIEIRDEVGAENMFIFGHTPEQIAALRASGYDPKAWIENDEELERVVETIENHDLPIDAAVFRPIVEILTGGDRYFHCADFRSYLTNQSEAAAIYGTTEWVRRSILNVAGMGRFSSDRTVAEYAEEIWNVKPVTTAFNSSR